MTLDNFVKKYQDTRIDFDGSFGAQCVDLYRQYVKDVLKIPQSPSVVGAKDIWDKYLPDHYTRVPNTPDGVPPKGSVVIWGIKYGEFGHVAISMGGDTKGFTAFSQNDPVGSKCVIRSYKYTHVLGWLIPKNAIITPDMPTYLPTLLKEDLGIDTTKSEGDVRGRIGEIKDKLNKYDTLEKDFKLARVDLRTAEEELASLKVRVEDADKDGARLEEEVKDLKELVTNRDIQINDLTNKVDSLTSQLDPEQVVVVKKEEYEALISTDPLKRFSKARLFVYLLTGK